MLIERDLRELSNVSSHHFPDRSAKWLIRQREHLEALLRMVAGQIADALDFAHVEQLNRSFISDELRPQESDMVFRVPFRSPTQTRQEVIVYLLIEHQSTIDPSMALRLLSYMIQIWMEEHRQWQEERHPQSEWQLTPIVPIVFYTGKGAWRVPLSDRPPGHPGSPYPFRPDFRHLAPRCQSHGPRRTDRSRSSVGMVVDCLTA